jgi:hypothetical protein
LLWECSPAVARWQMLDIEIGDDTP